MDVQDIVSISEESTSRATAFVRRMEVDLKLDLSEIKSLLYWSVSKIIRYPVDLNEKNATLSKQLESKMVEEEEGSASNGGGNKHQ